MILLYNQTIIYTCLLNEDVGGNFYDFWICTCFFFDQNLDSQIEQLRNAKVDQIVHEKISGVLEQKEKLDHLLNQLVKGDTLVVTSGPTREEYETITGTN